MPAALELTEPYDAAFVLGPIGLGYDRSADRVVLQLDEFVPVTGEPPTPRQEGDRRRAELTAASSIRSERVRWAWRGFGQSAEAAALDPGEQALEHSTVGSRAVGHFDQRHRAGRPRLSRGRRLV